MEKLSQNWAGKVSTRGNASAEINNKLEKSTKNTKSFLLKGKFRENYVKMRRFFNYKQYFRSQKLEILNSRKN